MHFRWPASDFGGRAVTSQATVLYNAIVHEVITSGRSVQLWYSLVEILAHICEVRLDVGQRSRVDFGIFPYVYMWCVITKAI